MRSWFAFNGIDSRTMDIWLESETALQRPKERVKQVNILGRAGALTLTEGEDVYEGYMQTVNLSVYGERNVNRVYAWLKGDGFVTFSNDPDRKQEARIINGITLTRVSHNLDYWKGQVVFYCQPYKQGLYDDTVTVTDGEIKLRNTGAVAEKPVFTYKGMGNLTLTFTDNSGSTSSLVITGITDEQRGCVIDCDLMQITSLSGTELMTAQSDGDFPAFPVGAWSVSTEATGILTVTRRLRYL